MFGDLFACPMRQFMGQAIAQEHSRLTISDRIGNGKR